jgi:hypothetical protein
LIVVGIGLSTGLLSELLFAELVVMIVGTTVFAPIVLRVMISREQARHLPST